MSDALYGDQTPQAKAKAPSLLEQIEGVFTAPRALFDRLNKTPSWVPALLLAVALGLIVVIAWGLKVDADAMMRPGLERNPQMTADQIDTAVQMGSKFILPFGILGVLFGIPIFTLIAGLINWGLGRGMTEPGANPPSFLHGLSSAVVPSLVRLPDTLIVIAVCLLKPVGGLKPDQVAPTSLGYFIHTASPKLQALLYALNPFTIASLVMLYFAMRHTVKAKTSGAAIAVGIVVLIILLGVVFAK
ncbi:MAG TPA: YIP1 family protein [Holophagaceae bacterium]|nr:YIP1 family protein [Holophagaceae bacterium]